ncbi:MAG: hypothetical protein QW231_05210 [Candidatus Bathyarchaeia archaeon]
MDILVNQSWKVEQTNRDTRVAAVRGRDGFVVVIDRKLKRRVLRDYRDRFSGDKALYVRMFGAGVFLAIQPLYAKGDRIIIDIEYPGHERTIIRHITGLIIRRFRHLPKRDVLFTAVGKRSAPHFIARNPEHASKGYIVLGTKERSFLLEAMNLL